MAVYAEAEFCATQPDACRCQCYPQRRISESKRSQKEQSIFRPTQVFDRRVGLVVAIEYKLKISSAFQILLGALLEFLERVALDCFAIEQTTLVKVT